MHAPKPITDKAAIDGGVRAALRHDSGHKLGEFSPTRQFKGHAAKSDKAASSAPAPAPQGGKA